MESGIFHKRFSHILFLGIVSLLVSSCARAPVRPGAGPTEAFPLGNAAIPRQDVSHVVGPGETVWRIAKMYDVPMSAIVDANRLSSAEKLEMGQQLVVPKAAPLRPVIALFPSSKWKYIIIHHSATDDGNAYSLFALHKKRGFDGLGYDFIIDNGTAGKGDGQIEVSPRWIKQTDGAHCKAGGMNHQGIGICLVGNFSKEHVSRKQMDSLIYLVNVLRKYYRIGGSNILGHSQVPGASTECPGKLFPWKEFRSRL